MRSWLELFRSQTKIWRSIINSPDILPIATCRTTVMPTYIQELVNMTSLRISTTSTGEIPLAQGQGKLDPRTISVGAVTGDEELDALSSIIEALNERFGSNLDENDKLFFEKFTINCVKIQPFSDLEINEPDDVIRTFNQKMEDIMTSSVERNFRLSRNSSTIMNSNRILLACSLLKSFQILNWTKQVEF